MSESEILRRLDRLEAENRRLSEALAARRGRGRLPRTALAGLAAAVLVAVFAGADPVAKTPSADKVIEGSRIVLKDAEGRVRLTAGPADDRGGFLLRFFDPAGKAVASLGQGSNGAPGLHLFDAEGRRRTTLWIAPNGSTGLVLRDNQGAEGTTRMVVDVRSNGVPEVSLRDAAGKARQQFQVTPDGKSTIALADAGARDRVVLAATANGTGSLGLFSAPGKDALALTYAPDTGTSVSLFNARGNGGVQLTVGAKGDAGGLLFRDLEGRDRGGVILGNDGRVGMNLIGPDGRPTLRLP